MLIVDLVGGLKVQPARLVLLLNSGHGILHHTDNSREGWDRLTDRPAKPRYQDAWSQAIVVRIMKREATVLEGGSPYPENLRYSF